MTRICIVTPGQVGSNPRVVKEADALADSGFSVRVLATKVSEFVEPRDQAVIADAQYPIERLSFDDRARWIRERARQSAGRALYSVVPIPVLAERAISASTRLLASAAADAPADLYIAHYVAALPAAARAAKKYGADYAFDAEDFHLGDAAETPDNAFERRLIRDIEQRYLPGAAYITAASPMIADAYVEAYAVNRPAVVLNVFPRRNAPPGPAVRGTMSPGPSLYWFSQTIGPGRGLETAIEAIARAATAPHLYLRGTPAEGYVGALRALAGRHEVSDRLHILAPEVPGEMERIGAQYDLGYSGESGFSRNNSLALGNKLFSYLLGGIPILGSDTPAHRALQPELGEAMTLFPIGDAAALARAIDRFLLDPARLAAARAHAWCLGQERFCWDVEQRFLLDAVEGACSGASPKAA